MPFNSLQHSPDSDSTFPAIGEEPFNLTDDELWAAWQDPNQKTPEAEVSKHFERIFGGTFDLYPQVWMRDPNGSRYRIDYVGREKTGTWQGLVGFELKHGGLCSGSYTDFSAALSQSIDSSRSVINSDTFGTDWFSKQLRFVFLFPCMFNIYEADPATDGITVRDWQARGALKLAGKYGVGAIVRRQHDWVFTLAGHPAYRLNSGPTSLGIKHAIGTRGGSAK